MQDKPWAEWLDTDKTNTITSSRLIVESLNIVNLPIWKYENLWRQCRWLLVRWSLAVWQHQANWLPCTLVTSKQCRDRSSWFHIFWHNDSCIKYQGAAIWTFYMNLMSMNVFSKLHIPAMSGSNHDMHSTSALQPSGLATTEYKIQINNSAIV